MVGSSAYEEYSDAIFLIPEKMRRERTYRYDVMVNDPANCDEQHEQYRRFEKQVQNEQDELEWEIEQTAIEEGLWSELESATIWQFVRMFGVYRG